MKPQASCGIYPPALLSDGDFFWQPFHEEARGYLPYYLTTGSVHLLMDGRLANQAHEAG